MNQDWKIVKIVVRLKYVRLRSLIEYLLEIEVEETNLFQSSEFK